MHVGEVDVGEGDGAAVGQVARRRDLLGDRADDDPCAVITGASLVPVMVTSIVPGDQRRRAGRRA